MFTLCSTSANILPVTEEKKRRIEHVNMSNVGRKTLQFLHFQTKFASPREPLCSFWSCNVPSSALWSPLSAEIDEAYES